MVNGLTRKSLFAIVYSPIPKHTLDPLNLPKLSIAKENKADRSRVGMQMSRNNFKSLNAKQKVNANEHKRLKNKKFESY